MKDSEGENTKATFPLNDGKFPKNITICGAYMTEGWVGPTVSAKLFSIDFRHDILTKSYLNVDITADQTKTIFKVSLYDFNSWGLVFSTVVEKVWFPLSWLHICLSKESGSGKVVLVVDGQVLKEDVYKEAKFDGDFYRDMDTLRVTLGFSFNSPENQYEHAGMASNLNIFSSALDPERMVNITGGEECGAPGDYVSWDDSDWQLHSKARLMLVDVLEDYYPCKRESKVTTYSASFKTVSSCMNHCQKIGGGRSPSIVTYEEWSWMHAQYLLITPNFVANTYLWLAATDSEEEGVWKKGDS